jgi:CHAT domain-containing protein
VGLTRAFFYAGAGSLLATLWDVADEPARQLITSFYRHLSGGRSKSEALRAAQLELLTALRQGRVRVSTPLGDTVLPEHPVFWSGFVLLGRP